MNKIDSSYNKEKRKKVYYLYPKDLYDDEIWLHLKMRLPNGIKTLTGHSDDNEAMEMAGDILNDYMYMAMNDMIENNNMLCFPVANTGYVYIKDQKDFMEKSKIYKYDILLKGAFFLPVFIMDKALIKKSRGHYKILLNQYLLNKVRRLSKQGLYDVDRG